MERETNSEKTPPESDEGARLVRHEEELAVGRDLREIGRMRARKVVETETVAETVPRSVEQVELEPTPAAPDDPGNVETFPDGSVSIPVLAEEIVVSKRMVVKERVRITKRLVTEPAHIEAELRKERIELEADPGVPVDVVPGERGEEEMSVVDRNVSRVEARREEPRGWLDKAETKETKPFFLTSEFLVFLAAVGALAASIAVFDEFDLGRGLTLITALSIGYIVSRGLSKAGTNRWGR